MSLNCCISNSKKIIEILQRWVRRWIKIHIGISETLFTDAINVETQIFATTQFKDILIAITLFESQSAILKCK